MDKLYNELAEVYEAMYKTFINYNDEYALYSSLLVKYNSNSLIEIGCGTGNLASHFAKNGFEYTGLDISAEMLAIAKKNNPGCTFIQSTAQGFSLTTPVQSAIITGRTISYFVSNKDVDESFEAINNNLVSKGIVCFDFIDANKFIPALKGNAAVIHKAEYNGRKFHRESFWSVNMEHSWAFNWLSVFYEELSNGEMIKIGEDNSVIRAFTKDDIVLFLELNGFIVKEMIPRSTYAFDTFVAVAEKI